MRWPLATAWTCAALAVAAFAAALVLRSIDDHPPESAFDALGFALFAAPPLIAGVAIARNQPANPVGPIVAGLGLLPALDVALEAWASAGMHGQVEGAGWGALLFQSDWIPVFALLALLLLLFPDGHPIGPRWRWAVGLAVASPFVMLVGTTFRDARFDAPYEDVARPLPTFSGAPQALLSWIGLASLFAAVVLAAVSVILRLRRSRGVERTQIKWLAAAALLLPVALVAGRSRARLLTARAWSRP